MSVHHIYRDIPDDSEEAFYSMAFSNDPNSETPIVEYFWRNETLIAASEQVERRFRCIWFYEWGRFTARLQTVDDWMMYWWSESVGPERHYGRGQGWSAKEDYRTLRNYEPLAPDSLEVR